MAQFMTPWQVMLVMVLATVLLVYTAVGSPGISWEVWETPMILVWDIFHMI